MSETPILASGCYTGHGINHEGQNFTGTMVIRAIASGHLLWFRAQGDDGEVFHEEFVLIAPSPAGGLSMTSLNTNYPSLQSFTGTQSETGYIFNHGNPGELNSFRETVTINHDPAGGLGYAFAWGMPGQPVEARSSAVMHATDTTPPGCPISF